MYFDRPLQARIVQGELFGPNQRYPRTTNRVKITGSDLFRYKAKAYLKWCLETSSVHGLNHLVALRRHPFEILLWLIIVGLSVFGSVYLSRTTWLRYQYSPTVISMERDMFAWNTTFPCVTICPHLKVDSKKLAAYVNPSGVVIRRIETINVSYTRSHPETDKDKLKKFIVALSNASYHNFNMVPDYNGIPPVEFVDLILNVTPNFTFDLTVGAADVMLNHHQTITEMGICYSFNSKAAIYNSPTYRRENRWDLIKNQSTFFVHPLDGEVFAQVIDIISPYSAYIHGPMEVPDIASKYKESALTKYYMKIYVTAIAVYPSPETAKLSIAQRKCRFPEENNLSHNAIYTYNMCRMECRIQLCLKYCQCIPHFYRRIGDEKICDVKGLHCLYKHKDELSLLKSTKGEKIICDCLPICDDVNYVIQSNALQKWFLGTNLQWGLVTYPKMRYRRDIIFGFTDVLVAVGSMAGLFLGCCVLSFMEIIYFLTLRLFWYSVGK